METANSQDLFNGFQHFLLQKVRIVSQVFLTRSVLRSGNFSEVFIKIVRLMKKEAQI